MMDRETALRKIQKCLSLSKSSEPHEAARALAQAQKLMEQFQVDHPELGTVKPRRRELADTNRALDHQVNGYVEGRKAQVATALKNAQPSQLALGV